MPQHRSDGASVIPRPTIVRRGLVALSVRLPASQAHRLPPFTAGRRRGAIGHFYRKANRTIFYPDFPFLVIFQTCPIWAQRQDFRRCQPKDSSMKRPFRVPPPRVSSASTARDRIGGRTGHPRLHRQKSQPMDISHWPVEWPTRKPSRHSRHAPDGVENPDIR